MTGPEILATLISFSASGVGGACFGYWYGRAVGRKRALEDEPMPGGVEVSDARD